ncbi:hypothetical protein [Listeria booriae]|uniref:hypothetical protein n=1 Tax=Listeria booriae TaxID=1552123 RepID=UPI001624D590|nr:hypothetical protein [Listeria booriae]MBC1247346.1 hypothetical protein [Listeria booriae]
MINEQKIKQAIEAATGLAVFYGEVSEDEEEPVEAYVLFFKGGMERPEKGDQISMLKRIVVYMCMEVITDDICLVLIDTLENLGLRFRHSEADREQQGDTDAFLDTEVFTFTHLVKRRGC